MQTKEGPRREQDEETESTSKDDFTKSPKEKAIVEPEEASAATDEDKDDAARLAKMLEEDDNLGNSYDTFPKKLMELLNSDTDEELKACLRWLPEGDAFCIIPDKFAVSVMEEHFQGTKFASFKRKLNRWGFRKAGGQKYVRY
jgi:HSF-type DNA-binding